MSDQDPTTSPPEDPELQDLTDPEEASGSEWTPPTREEWEKLDRAAKRRDSALRKAQGELAQLKKAQEGADAGSDPQDDPVARAKGLLTRESTRTALAAAGVTDRADQKAVLDALNLSGIEVDDDGPNLDDVEDLVATLRRVFGRSSGEPGRVRPRSPRVDPRDRGGSSVEPVDVDSQRYRRIITGRRG